MAGCPDRVAPDADVVIVGTGPAGAAAAIACARSGLRTALLERSELPRERPGETLHPGVEAPLRQLGVLDRVLLAGLPRHRGVWVTWDGATRLEPYGGDEHGPWQGFQALRGPFDALLVARAEELGAVIHQRCRGLAPIVRDGSVVGVATSAGELRARYLVDAAGAGHWLARHLGLALDRRSPPLIARFGYASGRCPQRDGAPAIVADADGWTWAARVADGVYGWTRLALSRPRGGAATAPAELAGLQPRGRPRSADVSWRALRRPAGRGFVAAGDAALVLDPASSHGVLRALLSGMHAARLVGAVLGGGDEARLSHAYSAFIASWFAHDVAALHALYGRLREPPDWLGAAPGRVGEVAARPRPQLHASRRVTLL
jgi:flavin-dependent dehydrogenase